MHMNNVQVVVLAAGKSARFKTGNNKLLEKICGQPIIIFTTKLFTSLHIPMTIVIGHQKERIQQCIDAYHENHTIRFAVQEKQQGTAHALACTGDYWDKDHILIMNGDMPLVTKDIIQELYTKHIDSNATLSFVMAHHTDPNTGYGRVVKTDNNIKIVEANEFTSDSNNHCCINAGIYLVKKQFLQQYIHTIEQNKLNQEFYITHLIQKASELNEPIATISAPFDFIRGINNQHELWAAEQVQRSQIIKHWMEHGVRFSVAHNVHIDLNVTIGAGTYIGCGVHLLYGTSIGNDCKIHEYASLENTVVGNGVHVYPFSIIKDAHIEDNAQVGPFAHIRNGSVIGERTVIGNFVEVKHSTLDTDTKVKHLSYIGDATIGKQVNIGAGTIVCNYDGTYKHKTTIEDNAFIGSNNTLIAPITIGNNAFTAGGSTLTQNVPPHALAIARNEQIIKHNYRQKNDPEITNSTETKKEETFVGAFKTTNDASLIHENDSV